MIKCGVVVSNTDASVCIRKIEAGLVNDINNIVFYQAAKGITKNANNQQGRQAFCAPRRFVLKTD